MKKIGDIALEKPCVFRTTNEVLEPFNCTVCSSSWDIGVNIANVSSFETVADIVNKKMVYDPIAETRSENLSGFWIEYNETREWVASISAMQNIIGYTDDHGVGIKKIPFFLFGHTRLFEGIEQEGYEAGSKHVFECKELFLIHRTVPRKIGAVFVSICREKKTHLTRLPVLLTLLLFQLADDKLSIQRLLALV